MCITLFANTSRVMLQLWASHHPFSSLIEFDDLHIRDQNTQRESPSRACETDDVFHPSKSLSVRITCLFKTKKVKSRNNIGCLTTQF